MRKHETEVIRVLLLARAGLRRDALAALLRQQRHLKVVEVVSDVAALLAAVRSAGCEVVLWRGEARDVDALPKVAQACQAAGVHVLLLTEAGEVELHQRALAAGVRGVSVISAETGALLQAIERVAAGNLHIESEVIPDLLKVVMVKHAPPQEASTVVEEPQLAARPAEEKEKWSLSPREMEVLQLLCMGLSSREIAQRLHLSRRTVDNLLGRMYQKTQTTGRTGLAVRAKEEGLCD